MTLYTLAFESSVFRVELVISVVNGANSLDTTSLGVAIAL